MKKYYDEATINSMEHAGETYQYDEYYDETTTYSSKLFDICFIVGMFVLAIGSVIGYIEIIKLIIGLFN